MMRGEPRIQRHSTEPQGARSGVLTQVDWTPVR